MNQQLKKLAIRFLYFCFLIGIGFAGERLYYGNEYSLFQRISESPKSSLRIVIAGGSQSAKIDSYIEKYLQRVLPNLSVEVFPLVVPGFTSVNAIEYHNSIFARYRPHWILYMPSCVNREFSSNKKKIESIDQSEIAQLILENGEYFSSQTNMFLNDLDSKKYVQNFEKILLFYLKNGYQSKTENLFYLLWPKILNKSSLVELDKIIEDLVLDRINSDSLTELDHWLIIDSVISIGHKVRAQMADLAIELTPYENDFYRDKPLFTASDLQQKIEMIDTLVAQKIAKPAFKTCSRFDSTEKMTKYEHYWLCAVLKFAMRAGVTNRDTELREIVKFGHYATALGFLPGDLNFLEISKSLVSKKNFSFAELTALEFRDGFINTKYQYMGDLGREAYPRFSQEQIGLLMENLKVLKELSKKSGENFAFIQLPNIRSLALLQACQHFSIPIFDSHGLFDQLIAENGYDTYFYDHSCGSGHMTPAAMDIFAEHLAKEFLPHLGQSP